MGGNSGFAIFQAFGEFVLKPSNFLKGDYGPCGQGASTCRANH